MVDYGKTLNLPQTDFPMRGNLPQREPVFLENWEKINIYQAVAEKNAGKEKFILHDGPPYANGDIHLGHVLNKVLKDIVVKYKSMTGFDAPYIPGWDTHGLPIEQRAIKDLGINRHQVSKVEFRDKCKEFALKYVNLQRDEFKRLGVRADWEHPYITLQPEYEAVQIAAFGEMAKKGYIYKGLKPVYWCPECETALAEAEVEYADHKSPSIFVKFKVKDGKGLLPEDAYVVIWTTTPWTIPSNLAICIHPDFEYALFEADGVKMVVAKELLFSFAKEVNLENYTILQEFKGCDLELIKCQHPLFDRESPIILGDHVTLEAGTGCVHTAPGHGADDFIVGKKYGLDILSPLDDKGRFTKEAGQFEGLDTNEGNKAVITALNKVGALMKVITISHQYPHCWRCHKPILFRATEQWFASIDGFRQQALAEIDKVQWVPNWGHDRIYNMVKDRGDWCISRQRTWGVPIPIFYCKECNEPIVNDETIAHIQALVKEYGSSVWFAREVEDLIPAGLTCPKCGHQEFKKETDIMDVWFDSGSSSFAVLATRPELHWPADLYLEGSDQHRGWFNSSLSIAVATRGQAPYKQVLTHGFIVDEKGRKMSKSLGNTVDPLKVIKDMGADVLRLWVSSCDYRSDLASSPGIMKQVSEAYRKIRNTARFLLGNLYDFDPTKDMVAVKDMAELDQWAMYKLQRLIDKSMAGYDSYEFHVVYHALHKFCVVDMSALYLDIVKDNLYVEVANSGRRRSIQTVLYHVIEALVRILAPITTFTAEEIYSFLPKQADSPISVQLLDMPKADLEMIDTALEDKWDTIFAIRETVSKELEVARRDKKIGHPLDAAITIFAPQAEYDILTSIGKDLPSIFIVSQAALHLASDGNEVTVTVDTAKGQKCERCWIYSETVGADAEHPTLCSRCADIMQETGAMVEN